MMAVELSAELATTIRELGEARVAACLQRANAWRHYGHLPVTERREEVRSSTAQLDSEVMRLEAEVEALRVELDSALRQEGN